MIMEPRPRASQRFWAERAGQLAIGSESSVKTSLKCWARVIDAAIGFHDRPREREKGIDWRIGILYLFVIVEVTTPTKPPIHRGHAGASIIRKCNQGKA